MIENNYWEISYLYMYVYMYYVPAATDPSEICITGGGMAVFAVIVMVRGFFDSETISLLRDSRFPVKSIVEVP